MFISNLRPRVARPRGWTGVDDTACGTGQI